jgi:hypothetical protein
LSDEQSPDLTRLEFEELLTDALITFTSAGTVVELCSKELLRKPLARR